MRMRMNGVIGLLATGLLVFGASAASAMTLEARINAAASNPMLTQIDANTATGTLTAGDTIGVEIFVDNLTADVVTAIFATLTWDGTKVAFLGGGFTGAILAGTCTGFSCVAPSLGPGIGAPILKPLSPFGQMTGLTDWLQVFAHTNPAGTNGAGPDQVTVTMGFQVLAGGAGDTEILFPMIIEPNSDTVAGAGGGTFLGPLTLVGAGVNVPEPGSLALGLASLLSVGVIARRRGRAHA